MEIGEGRNCQQRVNEAAYQSPITRLMLGPGDSFNGQTITAQLGEILIRIYGGKPAYSSV
jgi:hypothetical protein